MQAMQRRAAAAEHLLRKAELQVRSAELRAQSAESELFQLRKHYAVSLSCLLKGCVLLCSSTAETHMAFAFRLLRWLMGSCDT